ncbi:peptidoglycan-binding protein [Clostridium baratii]|uniref:peptidoglycan-binding domain-containing protein n=1 Tax=Clostridium baratii TaxID=1561 RepID=UPI0028FFBE88|nr:peptidoglycan-binding protein [Clostridium baratii]MDU1053456.1 peptidoglycan-binding protein [Clostridium baratii]
MLKVIDGVKDLQREFNKQFNAGFFVDGYIIDSTLAASIIVKEGSEGNLTRLIQQRLLNRGYDSLKVHWEAEGVCGTVTTAFIENLQKNKGVSVGGIVGKDTWKALYSK